MENAKHKFLVVDEFVTVTLAKGDSDFSAFCQNLAGRPKFGYGPIEPEIDAYGRLVALSFGPVANSFSLED